MTTDDRNVVGEWLNARRPVAERARLLFEDGADERFVAGAERLVAVGRAEWVADPWVDEVGALVLRGTHTALIVVYLHRDDWEVSEDFEDLVD